MQRNLSRKAVTASRSHLLPAQTVQTDCDLPNVLHPMKTSGGSLRLDRSSITICTATYWSPGCPTRQICRRSPWRYSLYIVISPCIYRHTHIPSLRLLARLHDSGPLALTCIFSSTQAYGVECNACSNIVLPKGHRGLCKGRTPQAVRDAFRSPE
jgi:hypothetical protein